MIECGEDGVRGCLPVEPHLHQPTGIVHGGVYASVAKALASSGTNWAVTPNGEIGLGMWNGAGGRVHAVSRVTIAVRPRRNV